MPLNMHAAAEEAPLPRMRGAVAPTKGSAGLQRLRGTVTLSLKTPEAPAAAAIPGAAAALGAVGLPLPLDEEEPPTMPSMRAPKAVSQAASHQAIADMAGRLGIPPAVRDRALDVFRGMEERKGRSHQYYAKGDALYAACLYVACRREGVPRTFKELAAATRGGAAARKDIGRIISLIRKRLGDEAGGEAMDIGVVRAADYVGRFGNVLGMTDDEVRAVQEAARRMQDQLDVRRNPDSTAAAIIYMAMERRAGAGAGRSSIRDVSVATGVAENTIKQAYREISPHAVLLFD